MQSLWLRFRQEPWPPQLQRRRSLASPPGKCSRQGAAQEQRAASPGATATGPHPAAKQDDQRARPWPIPAALLAAAVPPRSAVGWAVARPVAWGATAPAQTLEGLPASRAAHRRPGAYYAQAPRRAKHIAPGLLRTERCRRAAQRNGRLSSDEVLARFQQASWQEDDEASARNAEATQQHYHRSLAQRRG